MPANSEPDRQIDSAVSAIHDCLGKTVVAVYLHGSAGSRKLRPQSDIDLLVVVDHCLTYDRREALLMVLLRLSSRYPAKPKGPRCLDVSVFRRSELTEATYPARAEFIYGEWLREIFVAGERPVPARDPENTLILAQIRREALTLFGPSADQLLPDIPSEQIRWGIRDALPTLLDSLHGDERNVVLTLARMWYTLETGAFVAKDAAAEWAIPQIGDRDAAILEYARKAYLGENVDEWRSRSDGARRLAECIASRIKQSL